MDSGTITALVSMMIGLGADAVSVALNFIFPRISVQYWYVMFGVGAICNIIGLLIVLDLRGLRKLHIIIRVIVPGSICAMLFAARIFCMKPFLPRRYLRGSHLRILSRFG